MSDVKANLEVFKKYNEYQALIDQCNRSISEIKTKPDNSLLFIGAGLTIRERLGNYLTERIGGKIVKLIEAEIVELTAEQSKLELK